MVMPSKRNPSQTTLTLSIPREMLSEINNAVRKHYAVAGRSQLIREAVVEHLQTLGCDTQWMDITPPMRLHDKPSTKAPLPQLPVNYKNKAKKDKENTKARTKIKP